MLQHEDSKLLAHFPGKQPLQQPIWQQFDRCLTSSPTHVTNSMPTSLDTPTTATMQYSSASLPLSSSSLSAFTYSATSTTSRAKKGSRKIELDLLRIEYLQLLELFQQLQLKKHQDDEGSCKWKLIAKYQAARKRQCFQENLKLRVALREQLRVTDMLQRTFGCMNLPRQPTGSVEEFEWKVGVLSQHPERRKYNVELMMNHFYGDIPSRAIRSGLLEVNEPIRFSKASNTELLDQPVYQTVNLCAHFTGNYLKLADNYWLDREGTIPLDNMYVESDIMDEFEHETLYWAGKTYYVTKPSSTDLQQQEQTPIMVGPIFRVLTRRVDSDGCVTIFFRTVRETDDEDISSISVAEDYSGWFTLQDGGVDAEGKPMTVYKCSMSTQLKPITHRLNWLVKLANEMNLGKFPSPSLLDYASRKRLERHVRGLLVQFVTNMLWTAVEHHQERITRHSRGPLK